MLKHAALPNGYWCYAIQCAVYLYNRSSHASLPQKISPWEAHYQEKPSLSNVVPFGCIGVAAIDPSERPAGGLGERGMMVRMLSYDRRHNTYVVCTSNPNTIYRRRITKWYPNKYNFPSIPKPAPKPPTHSTPSPSPPASTPRRSSRPTLAKSGLPRLGYFDLQAQREAIASANKLKNQTPSSKMSYLGCISAEEAECILSSTSISVHDIEDIPRNYKDAMSRQDKKLWEAAMRKELQSFVENKVFKIVPKTDKIKTVKYVDGCTKRRSQPQERLNTRPD